MLFFFIVKIDSEKEHTNTIIIYSGIETKTITIDCICAVKVPYTLNKK